MITKNYNLFHGELLKLSAPREEDTEIMVKWWEDPDYLRNLDTEFAIPKSKEQLAEEGEGTNTAYFRLRTIKEDQLIGFAAIHSIEWNNRAALMAIGIGDVNNRGKGYGSDALRIVLRYAFHELNLDRVGLEVIEYNHKGIRAYEKVGFQQEGRKRSAVYRDGKKYDLIVMGVLREEWEAVNNVI